MENAGINAERDVGIYFIPRDIPSRFKKIFAKMNLDFVDCDMPERNIQKS